MVKTPRPWKGVRATRTSAMAVRFGADGRSSWATKMAQREERAALVAASAARAAAHGAAAKAERERRQAKRERKEANRLRSAKTQVVRLCVALRRWGFGEGGEGNGGRGGGGVWGWPGWALRGGGGVDLARDARTGPGGWGRGTPVDPAGGSRLEGWAQRTHLSPVTGTGTPREGVRQGAPANGSLGVWACTDR